MSYHPGSAPVDPAGESAPRFGAPTQKLADLRAPDLGTNTPNESARIWNELQGMVEPFRISDIGFVGGKVWVGVGKRCYTLLEPSVLNRELYLALLDVLTQQRPALREAIAKDPRVEQDFSCEMADAHGRLMRFRVNFAFSAGMPGVVMRPLPDRVPRASELKLDPGLVETVMTMRRGIVILAGTTNSGKSTTIAALLEEYNHRHRYHIVTLEDPVETRFRDNLCTFTQREVGTDTLAFGMGLRAAMRQSPHVIFVGEMRDYETVHTACLAAETGHIVLSTTHSDGVALAPSRLVDTAPHGKERELRKLLSRSLTLIVYQTLPRLRAEEGGGRECLREILHVDHAASAMIADGRDKSLNDHMLQSEEKGNKLFARAFLEQEYRLEEEDSQVLRTSFAEQFGGKH